MKRFAIVAIMVLAGCSNHSSHNLIAIKLTDSGQLLQVSGFDKAIISDVARDTTTGLWQTLLPVYKMPADTDMKDFQNPQPGKYSVKDNLVVFTPDTAFKKGQMYFLRCFDYQGAKDAWQILAEKKHLGASKHRDLTFCY